MAGQARRGRLDRWGGAVASARFPGNSPMSPFRANLVGFQAGRLMLKQIHEHARRGDNFAFETTLSGAGYARWIPRWQMQGYRVKLFFLRRNCSPDLGSRMTNS